LRILVHICCAPCFGYIHKVLVNEGFDIVGYFFNPNIHPYQEFLKRLHCLQRYTSLRPVEIIYNRKYELEKYLVGALKAKYDTPSVHKIPPPQVAKPGGFQDRVEVKDTLQIKLTPKDKSKASTESIKLEIGEAPATEIEEQRNNRDFNPRCGYCIGLRLAKTAEYAAKNGFEAFTTTLLESKYQPHDEIRSMGAELAEKHGIEFYYKDFREGWKESIKISKDLELYRQQYCGCIFSEFERYRAQ